MFILVNVIKTCFKSIFDGELFGREVVAKIATDVSYMYLVGMEKPDFRTINRFKVGYAKLN